MSLRLDPTIIAGTVACIGILAIILALAWESHKQHLAERQADRELEATWKNVK